MDSSALADWADARGLGAYRGRQIAKQLYQKAAQTLDVMTELPAKARQTLENEVRVSPLHVADHRRSVDDVDKMLVHNGDGNVYECVLLPYKDRVSCCLSTQVGCPMGCVFCATGLGGFDRNLTVAEIIGQYLLLQSISERRVSHVVFMGMGEPLLNLDNVIEAMRLMHEEVGLSYRQITISTVGLVPQILRLSKEKLPIHLALSLHSPLDEVRSRLMPVNHKWPVAEVMDAMRTYHRETRRKVTLEYLLLDGVNDDEEQAKALARLVKGLPSVINVIPWNWVDTGNGFKRPSRERVRKFKEVLKAHGANVTERVERGHDIAAACGQLAGQHQGKFAKRKESLWSIPVSPSS